MAYDENTLRNIANRQVGKERAVFTNGCFDILHPGHVRYLAEARSLGDFLVVGLNSDSSIRRLKGENRPVCNEQERLEVLRALRPVDYVIVFEEDTPEHLIERVRPAVLVKGGDWPEEKIVGASFVRSYGGEVKSLPFHQGKSTTDIIARIRAGRG